MNIERVAAALAGLAPYGIVTGVRRISVDDVASLHPDEAHVVARAVERRRNEFASGRALLRDLIGSDQPIPVGPTRAPVFPAGVSGSLAHDQHVAIAAISREPGRDAIGVDVEPDDPLADDMARVILRADEAGIDAHLAFTLKEAAYKAWSNAGGRMLGHHDVRVTVDNGTFTATVLDTGQRLVGRHVTVDHRHLALVTMPGASS